MTIKSFIIYCCIMYLMLLTAEHVIADQSFDNMMMQQQLQMIEWRQRQHQFNYDMDQIERRSTPYQSTPFDWKKFLGHGQPYKPGFNEEGLDP